MNLLEALNWRYAVKFFSDEKISEVELKSLLNATRLSASSFGLQPYTMIVVKSREVRQQLLPFSYGQDKIAYSSHLIIFAVSTQIGDTTVDRYISKYAQIANKSHDELMLFSKHVKSMLATMTPGQKQAWAREQAYIALGHLLTCAALMKIDSCPMTGFDSEGYDNVLRLSEKDLTTTVICPIGRRHPDDTQADKPKIRFDYQDLVMEV